MMKIEFTDGTMMDCEGVYSSACFYQGVSRDMYTFLFSPEADLNALSDLFTPENCKRITIHTDDGGTFVHEHFTIRYGLGCSAKENAMGENANAMKPPANDGEDDGQKVFLAWVKMIQTTLAERKILEQQEVLDTLLVSQLMG